MSGTKLTPLPKLLLLICLKTLLFVLLCIKVSNVLETFVTGSPTVVKFWSGRPCSWCVSEVAAVLTDVSVVQTISLVLQSSEATSSFWPKQLRMI